MRLIFMRYLATSDFVFPVIITGVRGKVWFCYSNHDFICRTLLFCCWCVIFSFSVGPIVKVSAISCDQIWKLSKSTLLKHKADTVRSTVRLLHLLILSTMLWGVSFLLLLESGGEQCQAICLILNFDIRVCWPFCGWAPAWQTNVVLRVWGAFF